jgi:2,3-bisphosphoglycerate-independent phosphoglycerate mutase
MSDKTQDQSPLEDAREALLSEMASFQAETDEYAKCIEQLVKIEKLILDRDKLNLDRIKLEAEFVADREKSKITLRDWIPAISSAAGIVLIVGFESAGRIFTSKAMTFVPKSR